MSSSKSDIGSSAVCFVFDFALDPSVVSSGDDCTDGEDAGVGVDACVGACVNADAVADVDADDDLHVHVLLSLVTSPSSLFSLSV